ncbi:sensor histidine kinase [Glycomyces harbinensis]|uniref:histidine kinase n=1 Tax=Glycomyces harbinensis TaxID=58114 RepID=A0A1G6WPB0_9ACTN|nr:histidine kinase [Glycomyces harbinensis]SDD67624.1 Signal transduction histidine kinase [Glycomyces harbinensis]
MNDRWHNGPVRLLAPLWSRATYRGWVWMILGGALMMPFMMVGAVFYNWRHPQSGFDGVIHPTVYVGVIPLVAAVSLLLPDREVERTAARRLLDAQFASPDDGTWNTRWRTGCWFTLHAAIGGLLSGVTLAMVPFAAYLAYYGALLALGRIDRAPDLYWGWFVEWGALTGPLLLVVLVALIAAATAGMRALAPLLLGQSAADRLAASSAESARLAARNRIARELHDSVGHALSVVVVQSEAAARLIESDPAFAAKAMNAVGETARGALAELDAVIGALREDRDGARGPQRDLADLQALADESGVETDLQLTGDADALSRLASREIYRIVQESLTNVLRHADEPRATVVVAVGERECTVTVTSPAARRPRRGTGKGGRGLIGMAERAAVLGGTAEASWAPGRWTVLAAVPLETGKAEE